MTTKEKTHLIDAVEQTNNTLIQWIKKNDGFIHQDLSVHSQINNDEVFRSIYYKNKIPISVNETITKIPYNLVISADTFAGIPKIEHWEEVIKEKHSKFIHKAYLNHFKIIVALLHEREKEQSSFYSPYINTLPKINSFDNHPIILYFDNKHKFDILKKLSPHFIEQLDYICSEMSYIIELFFLCNKSFQIFDSELYSDKYLEDLLKWAFAIKKTRSWEDGLVPFNDFFNHHDNSAIRLGKIRKDEGDINKKFYVFKADEQFKDIKNNDEIFDNYGYYNSMILLIFYNFLQPTKISHLNVPFDFSKTPELNKLIIAELKKCELSSHNILLSNNGPTEDLFKILRILSLTNEELLMNKDKNGDLYDSVISNKNEIKSVRFLLKLVLNMKKISYSLENMNQIHELLIYFDRKTLLAHEVIIKNVCLIVQDEYKIIEDNLEWIGEKLEKIIENSNI